MAIPGFRMEGTSPAQGNLIAGGTQLVSRLVTFAAGQRLERGAIVGAKDADDQHLLSAAAAVDGSQDPRGVVVDIVDTTDGVARLGSIYVKGEFAAPHVVLGAGHTVASIYNTLADRGIYLKDIMEA